MGICVNYFEIRRLIIVMGSIATIVVVIQLLSRPYEHSLAITVTSIDMLNNSKVDSGSENNKRGFNYSLQINEDNKNSQTGFISKENGIIDGGSFVSNDISVDNSSLVQEPGRDLDKSSIGVVIDSKQIVQALQRTDTNVELLQPGSVLLKNKSTTPASILIFKRRAIHTSISMMNSLLHKSLDSSRLKKEKPSSVQEHELLSAKLEIESAPILRNKPDLHASVFRNVSIFKRSYELMEQVLKVYVYSEGEKPIFHEPQLKGIYASEGWFMKLLKANKQFIVRDPRKAHLFYLPFSSRMLRTVLDERNSPSWKDMEKYLTNYVDLIADKYPFWNRTGGADHFLVACHDWASRITRRRLSNCIRALCNANVAKGFRIGKDTTLPVTYVRKAEEPLRDLGGQPPSARPTLAFFAGSMHGYLRPLLLEYWGNKDPDMKIFESMPRNSEGKKRYREHMKTSKYCICARGYEVHTPRVIESISHECVPVIISDNYVPPFFEVLNWESFSVFVQEKDIPNLRNILLSIPNKKYLAMQRRVKMVQKHFLWHIKPVKYDLFHMILHSIWYIRIFG